MKKCLFIIIVLLAYPVAGWAEEAPLGGSPLGGYWFECEFAGSGSPPRDGCAMLDDDGVRFEDNRVTLVKVLDSTEAESCHKRRAGQCFRAAAPAITIKHGFKGRIIKSSSDSVTVRVFGCRQAFSLRPMGAGEYYEIRADDADGLCWWTRPLMRGGYKYVRPYKGEIGRGG